MTVYIEISDVLSYFKYHATVSGIQRVQIELYRCFRDNPDYVFVFSKPKKKGFIIAATDYLDQFVRLVDAGERDVSVYQRLINQIEGAEIQAFVKYGDVLLISGAFWISPNTIFYMWSSKRAGAKVGFLCYDLIPIRNPEFCDPAVVPLFENSISSICQFADFAFTISQYVKGDLEAYIRSRGVYFPVKAVPLAHEINISGMKNDEVSSKVAMITEEPFVLFVSTIEARKNHLHCLRVWQRLLAIDPAIVPNLVWVGRRGWMVDDLFERVLLLNNLGGKLKIMDSVSDIELVELYRKCEFTIYPSYTEGWGLPVAESLMFGKMAVVSNSTSLPEVGGDYVWYIDPDNVTGSAELIREVLRTPEMIRNAEKRIVESFKPRRWRDVGNDVHKHIQAISRSRPKGSLDERVGISSGKMYEVGTKAEVGLSDRSYLQAIEIDGALQNGWYLSERWGRWMSSGVGSVNVDELIKDRSKPYLVKIMLVVYSGWTGQKVSIYFPSSGYEGIIERPCPDRMSIIVDVDRMYSDPVFEIRVDHQDRVSDEDERRLSVGLVGIGFAYADDPDGVKEIGTTLSGYCDLRLPMHKTNGRSEIELVAPIEVMKSSLGDGIISRVQRMGLRNTIARLLSRVALWLGRDNMNG